MKLKNEQQQILKDLYSVDEQVTLKAIKELRSKGGVFAIEALMEILFSNKTEEISVEINSLFRDLKDSKASIVIQSNLEKYQTSEMISDFISALWQSAIPFDSLEIFVKIFVSGNDNTAFEALTLIQQNAANLSDNSRKNCLLIVKSDIDKLSDFKKALAVDLIEVLK
ncbi:MAG: hypothetical protein JXR36_12215 [Bacteroidales bacterium]|nr:hypothetical protein [Bacteroidales bacterium]